VKILFEACNGEDFLDRLKEFPVVDHPEVVLMDVEMR
jgi:hypothetical protein